MKVIAFMLLALVVFGMLAGVFYAISVPILAMSIMQTVPSLSALVWIIIVGVPLGLTAQIMRMVYDVCRRRRR